MEAVPFTRVAGVLPLVHVLESVGAPVERLARRAGVPSHLFDRPEAPIPIYLASRFYELGARALGRRYLGANIGRETEIWDFGTYGSLLARGRTILEVLQISVTLLPRFATAHHDWLEMERDRVWLCQEFACEPGPGFHDVQAFTLRMSIRTIQGIVGDDWVPERIRVPDYGSDWVESLRIGCSIEIVPGTSHVALAIPRRLLPLPVRRRTPPPGSGLNRHLSETAAPADFVESVRLVIGSLLADECPHIDLVAEAARSSARTLQRQLAKEGWTYSQLLDQCRMERARELLGRPGARAIDVAFDLGYRDPANFSRAFRRWCGVTPREFRQQAAGDTRTGEERTRDLASRRSVSPVALS